MSQLWRLQYPLRLLAVAAHELDAMVRNADGSVDIYFGPTAPQGRAQNWIPTANRRPLPCMRLYGPTDAFNSKTFKLNDVEEVM